MADGRRYLAIALVAAAAGGAGVATATATDGASPSLEPKPCAPPFFGPGAGEGLNDPTTIPPTAGTLRLGMLFVDFADAPGHVEPAAVYDAWTSALAERYLALSYGRLRIDVQPLLAWLRLPETLAHYDAIRFEGAVESAVAAADERFDFRAVDALVLVTSTTAGFTLASTVLEHDPLQVDGRDLYAWTWISVAEPDALAARTRVLIHETGHLLGLPDLYVVGAPASYHRWDVMTAASGAEGMFGWHRWKLGWLDAVQVACLARKGRVTAQLTPLEMSGGRKLAVARLPDSAVVAEVRPPRPGCTGGVLVYRIELSQQFPRRPISVVAARRDDPRRAVSCGPTYNAPLRLARGRPAAVRVGPVDVQVVGRSRDGSFRIRLTRRR